MNHFILPCHSGTERERQKQRGRERRENKTSNKYQWTSESRIVPIGQHVSSPHIYVFITYMSIFQPPCCHGDMPCRLHHQCLGFALVSLGLPTRPHDPWCLTQIYIHSMTGRRAETPICPDNTHTLPRDIHTLMLKPTDTRTNSLHTRAWRIKSDSYLFQNTPLNT